MRPRQFESRTTTSWKKERVFWRLVYSLDRYQPLPEYLQRIIEKARNDGPDWEEIYALELALIGLVPADELRPKLAVLREEFQQSATGPEMQSLGGDAALGNMDREQMQRQASALLDELHQRRISLLKFQNARTAIVGCLVASIALGLVGAVAAGTVAAAFKFPKLPSAVLLATLSGFLGSAFSYLQRLRSLQWAPGFGMRGTTFSTVVWNFAGNMVLSFIIGMIAANVLLALFAVGIVSGELFPRFTNPSAAFGAINASSGMVLVKCGLWAFVAGFSERLVPDRLNHLAGIAAEQRSSRARCSE